MSDFKIKIDVGLKDGALSSIQKELDQLDLKVKITDIDTSILNKLNLNQLNQKISQQISTQMSNAGKNAASNFTKNFSLKTTTKQLQDVASALNEIGADSGSIQKVIKDLQNMNIQITKIKSSFDGDAFKSLNVDGITESGSKANVIIKQLKDNTLSVSNSLSTAFTQPTKSVNEIGNQFELLSTKITKLKAEIEIFKNNNLDLSDSTKSGLSNLTNSLDSLGNEKNLSKVTSDLKLISSQFALIKTEAKAAGETGESFDLISNKIEKIKAEIETFKNSNLNLSELTKLNLGNLTESLNGLNGETNVTKVTSDLKLLSSEFQTIKAQAKAAGETGVQVAEASQTSIKKLKTDIDLFIQSNSHLSSDTLSKLNSVIKGLSGEKLDTSQFRELSKEFSLIKTEAKAAGETGESFFDKFKNISEITGSVITFQSVFNSLQNGLKNGVSSIIELDSAMIELKKVCEGTSTSFEEFYYKANDIAKSLGQSTSTVISMTQEYAQMGYSLEDATTLAETTSKYATISPEMTTDEATSSMISVMKAYGIEAEDALDGIASKINYVGNSFAVTNSDIAEFLKRSASSMASANVSLDETIAMGEAITEVTRDASNTG